MTACRHLHILDHEKYNHQEFHHFVTCRYPHGLIYKAKRIVDELHFRLIHSCTWDEHKLKCYENEITNNCQISAEPTEFSAHLLVFSINCILIMYTG